MEVRERRYLWSAQSIQSWTDSTEILYQTTQSRQHRKVKIWYYYHHENDSSWSNILSPLGSMTPEGTAVSYCFNE